MGLQQTPAAFVQSLRLRIRALPRDAALLVVEGKSDRGVLLTLTTDSAIVVIARGKDFLIPAYKQLENHLRERVLFILDCDGNTPPDLKGHRDLILTTNRDLEADLIFEFETVHRLAVELMSDQLESSGEAARRAQQLTEEAADSALTLGLVQEAARSLRLRLRIKDLTTGNRRTVRPSDVHELKNPHSRSFDLCSVIDELALLLNWDSKEAAEVRQRAEHQRDELFCARHAATGCTPCLRMRYCNGHHLVDALSIALRSMHSINISTRELDSLLRVAGASLCDDSWAVTARIRAWETASGFRALTESPFRTSSSIREKKSAARAQSLLTPQ